MCLKQIKIKTIKDGTKIRKNMKAKKIKRLRKKIKNERWLYSELTYWQIELESSLFFDGNIDLNNPRYIDYLNRKSYFERKVKQTKNLINNL